jgi:UDP-glucose 4-epimerase
VKKNIFITGANSFVGKRLIYFLNKKKIYDIRGIDLLDTKNKKNIFKLDLRSKNLHKYIKKSSTIIHLAAVSRNIDFDKNISNSFDINIVGTINLLNAANKQEAERFIFASSEWVYPESRNTNFSEKKIYEINDIKSKYGTSKAIGEKLIIALSRAKYNILLRFGIIYGPRKLNFSAVESLFSSVKNKNNFEIGSYKTARRFIFVDDIVSAIEKSIFLNKTITLNITGNKLLSLKSIINVSKKILQKSPKIIESNRSKISIRNAINIDAKKILKWTPKYSLEKGLRLINNYFDKLDA